MTMQTNRIVSGLLQFSSSLSRCGQQRLPTVLSIAAYKSQYNLDYLYPNSNRDFVGKPHAEVLGEQAKNSAQFTGYIPLDKLTIKHVRASGPGGQNVNKVNSKVEIRFHVESAEWIPGWIRERMRYQERNRITRDGELIVTSDKTRKQMLNQADCLEKLRALIHRCSDVPEGPTEADVKLKEDRPSSIHRARARGPPTRNVLQEWASADGDEYSPLQYPLPEGLGTTRPRTVPLQPPSPTPLNQPRLAEAQPTYREARQSPRSPASLERPTPQNVVLGPNYMGGHQGPANYRLPPPQPIGGANGASQSHVAPGQQEPAGSQSAPPRPREGQGSQMAEAGVKRKQFCPLRDCQKEAKNIVTHALGRHLPPIFDPKRRPGMGLDEARLRLVHQLVERIQPGASPRQAMVALDEQNVLPGGPVSEVWQPILRRICRLRGWSCPDEFVLNPMSTPACLVHWRAVLALLGYLDRPGREDFRHMRAGFGVSTPSTPELAPPVSAPQPVPCRRAALPEPRQSGPAPVEAQHGPSPGHREAGPSRRGLLHSASLPPPLAVGHPIRQPVRGFPTRPVEGAEGTPPPSQPGGAESQAGREIVRLIPAIGRLRATNVANSLGAKELPAMMDSHFHLDRCRPGRNCDVQTFVASGGATPPRVPCRVIGGVAVYCDPQTYPSPSRVEGDAPFRVAVGIHPKKVTEFDQAARTHLKGLITATPRMVALGEVGLDFTGEAPALQASLLGELVQWVVPGQPIVLHLRGDAGDPYASEAAQVALDILCRQCPPSQRLHWHCFGGTKDQVAVWEKAFPNCYFGVTGQVDAFDRHQREAIRAISRDRLLLETDSPYLPVRRARPNHPAYIGEVAEVVAELLDLSLEEVATTTVANTRRLYCRVYAE